MMPTFRELIGRTVTSLSGYGSVTPTAVALTAAITDTDLVLPVASTAGFTAGLVEIDLESILIREVDDQNNALLVAPYGRGYGGTGVGVAHASGAQVTLNPTWPRGTVANLINELIQELYPSLYGVRVATVDELPTGRYALPDEARGVISVWQTDYSVTDGFSRVNQWSFDRNSMPDSPGLLCPAQGPLRVVYSVRPEPFALTDGLAADLDQDFATVTGLEPRLTGLITLGVAAKMAPYFDVARLPFASAEARAEGQANPQGAGAQTTRTLLALYQQRLDSEVAMLRKENPIRIHVGVN
jgi:hypothetical protein